MSTVSRSWFISFAVHLCLAGIIGGYLVTRSQSFKDLMGVEIFQPANKSRPDRKFGNPLSNSFKSQRHQSKTQSSLNQLKPNRERQMRLSFVQPLSNRGPSPRSQIKILKLNAPVNPNVPKVVNPHAPMPQVVTHTDVPASDAPDALALSSPVVTGTGKNGERMGRGIGGSGRGVSGGTVQVRIADVFKLPLELAMVEEVGAVRDALDGVVGGIVLGNLEVPPLPRGEPGGRVVGRGSRCSWGLPFYAPSPRPL